MIGAILYEGPSVLTGDPIVAIATGLGRKSKNEKTGAMIQTWILRADIEPTEAVRTGADEAICGACPLKGGFKERRCYVNVGQGPLTVYRAWKRGAYQEWNGEDVGQDTRPTRLGAYGDPAAVPVEIWRGWLGENGENTGYTHQWEHPHFDPAILELCMGSVESEESLQRFVALHPSARYFRVRKPGEERARGEQQCPASVEALGIGGRKTCADCLACGGTRKSGRNVSIAAHGSRGFEGKWNNA